MRHLGELDAPLYFPAKAAYRLNLLAVLFVAFFFGFVGSMPLAGPVALLVFARGVSGDFRVAFAIGIGAAVAEGIYAGIAFWGFSILFAGHPFVVPLSRAITAFVLWAVGIYFTLWSPRPKGPNERRGDSRTGTFFVGFTISALNPTLLVTWSAAVAWLYSKEFVTLAPWMAAPFGGMAAVGVATWFFVMIDLLRRYRERFPHHVLMWVIRGMGLVLIGLGVWSAVQLATWMHEHPGELRREVRNDRAPFSVHCVGERPG